MAKAKNNSKALLKLSAFMAAFSWCALGADCQSESGKIWNGRDYVCRYSTDLSTPVQFDELQVTRGVHVAFVPGTQLKNRILLGALKETPVAESKSIWTIDPELLCRILGYERFLEFRLGAVEKDDGRYFTGVMLLQKSPGNYPDLQSTSHNLLNRLVNSGFEASLYYQNLSAERGFAQHIQSLTCQ